MEMFNQITHTPYFEYTTKIHVFKDVIKGVLENIVMEYYGISREEIVSYTMNELRGMMDAAYDEVEQTGRWYDMMEVRGVQGTFGGKIKVNTSYDFSGAIAYILSDIQQQITLMGNILLQSIIQFCADVVPQRTGKLLDKIIESISIMVTTNGISVTVNQPTDYPNIISGSSHDGEIGYGPKYNTTYGDQIVIRNTKSGAYYMLHDTMALDDYMTAIEAFVTRILVGSVVMMLQQYVIVVEMNMGPSGSENDPYFLERDLDMIGLYLEQEGIVEGNIWYLNFRPGGYWSDWGRTIQ